jgi:DNA replication protein DnaC
MLIQPTLDKLNALKLNGMAIALSDQMTHAAAQGLAFEERLALLLDRESLYRENRRMTRLEQLAQFKQRAALEDLNYRDRTGLDRSQIAALAACDWIRANQNVLIHGATGSGKSFLACALGHQACRNGLSALYVRAPRLFEELTLCHADGSFHKRLAAIAKISVLIIDDFAIAPIGPRERNDLLELIDDRVGTKSCIVTSQLPIPDWHDYIGDPTLADAILDRILHRSHRIHLETKESIRKTDAEEEFARARAKKGPK